MNENVTIQNGTDPQPERTETPAAEILPNPSAELNPAIDQNPDALAKNMPIKNSWLFLLASFALALGTDLLTYHQALGKQFAIIVNALLVVAIVLCLVEKRKIPWQSWLLMGMVSVSSIMTVFRTEPFTIAALVIFVVIGLSLALTSMLSGQAWIYRVRDYIKRFFFLDLHGLIGLVAFIVESKKQMPKEAKLKKQVRTLGAVLLGVLIAIPLLLIFGHLLSKADAGFAKSIQIFLDFFKFEQMEDFWPQFIIVFILFWGFAGILYYTLSRSHQMEKIEPNSLLIPPLLTNTAAIVALSLLNALFLAFIVQQWGYFFGGVANINPNAHTYSSYATSGFNELMVAASISAFVHFLFSSITKRETKAEKWSFSVVATLLLILVGLMLVSAFQRLLLYESAYGFTRDRLVSHVFMVFLGLILIALAVMEITKNLKRVALVLLVSSFLFGITLAVINVDKTITRLNIKQSTIGITQKQIRRLDGYYLALSISEEAVPELYRNYVLPEQSEAMREDLGKILACRALRMKTSNPPGMWHTYQVPVKAEFDFFAAHGKELIDTYPPENQECYQGYMINGKFMDCVYDCHHR